MATTKFKIEKFTRSNDFVLWRLNMTALLVHQGLEEALKGEKGLPDIFRLASKIVNFNQSSFIKSKTTIRVVALK